MAYSVYDDALRNRVLAFQKAHGLTTDGVVAGETWAELAKAYTPAAVVDPNATPQPTPQSTAVSAAQDQSPVDPAPAITQETVSAEQAPESVAENAGAAEIRALLADDPEFLEMPEESRRELINQISAALDA